MNETLQAKDQSNRPRCEAAQFDYGVADNAEIPHTYVYDTQTGTTIAEFYFNLFGQRWATIEAENLCEVLNRSNG